jgi:hypothetical protein
LEIPRGSISAAYSRCALSTTVEVLDKSTDPSEWIALENSPYYTRSEAVVYEESYNRLAADMSLEQFK